MAYNGTNLIHQLRTNTGTLQTKPPSTRQVAVLMTPEKEPRAQFETERNLFTVS